MSTETEELFAKVGMTWSDGRQFPDTYTPSGAVFSRSMSYRPMLWRYWGPGKAFLHICGLNPSTADHEKNDPTIRREIDFAKRWGYDGLLKTNAFDLRATDPRVMLAHPIPLSDDNDWWISACQIRAAPPHGIAAWGVHGNHQGRADYLKQCYLWRCLGLTKDGFPRHPLYVRKDTKLVVLP